MADSWTGEVSAEYTMPQHGADGSSEALSFYLSGPLVGDTLGLQLWGRGYGAEESETVDGNDGARDRDIGGG